jgi:hypothetical protein
MNSPLRPEVEKAFAAKLELHRDEQGTFLARKYAHYPDLRAEVKSLGPLIEPPV